MKKKIVVVPASKWQINIIKFLRTKNYYVYSLDDNKNAEGHKYSNKRLDIKTSNSKKIKKFLGKNRVNIISVCSDFGEKICNLCLNKNNFLFNKYKQRLIQKKLNLDTPFFTKNLISKNKIKKYKKIISKPIYGSGSKNISIINNSKNKIKKKDYLFEEFVIGKEFSVDGFFYNEKFYLYAIMEKKKIRNSLTVSYIIKSNNLKQKNIDKIKKNLNLFFINAKYPNGPIHAEVIYNKKTDKIYFVESHPREAGFDVYYKLCKKITGLNLLFNTLKVKLNEKLNQFELASKNKYKYFCVRMIPVEKKGVVRKAFFSSIVKNKHIDVHTNVFVKPMDKIEYKNNDGSRLGYIMCWSNKISYLEKYSKFILDKNFILEYK